jgi:hypothetical protein
LLFLIDGELSNNLGIVISGVNFGADIDWFEFGVVSFNLSNIFCNRNAIF